MLPTTTPDLLNWMWQSTFCLGVCWLLYHLMLRKESCFHYNRQFLRFTPWLALLLPRLVAVATPWLGSLLPQSATPPPLSFTPAFLLPTLSISGSGGPAATGAWLWGLYGAGVLLGLARLGWHLLALWQTTHHLPREKHAGYTLVTTGGKLPVSSFGRLVFWDDTAALSGEEARQVLQHELVHVHQGHTWERLHLEVLRAILWFNPFVHAYPRALELTHEYLADAAVLAAAPAPATPTTYAALLARLTLQRLHPNMSLTHSFTRSHTLTRIAMLHSPSVVRRWKQWLLLPISTALLLTVAVANVSAQAVPPPPPPPPLAPPPPPVMTPPPPPPTLISSGSRKDGGEKVYMHAEQMPEYPGGEAQMMQDLIANLKYPASAKAAGLKGRAFIEFVVGADGVLRDVQLKKGLTAGPGQQAAAQELNEAALQAVRSLTAPWKPGQQKGKPVAVSFTIPLEFQP